MSSSRKKTAEAESRISRRKSDLTVQIIKYKHATDKMTAQLLDCLRECIGLSKSFEGQRMLFARAKMQERVMNAALKAMSQNGLQLWMIDDHALEDEER